MKKYNSSNQVLSKLNIKNFNAIDKNNVNSLISMIDDIDPEVLKCMLEVYPNIMKAAEEYAKGYQEYAGKVMDSNQENMSVIMNNYTEICKTIEDMLKDGCDSFDEKLKLLEYLKLFADRMDEKDTENKKWLSNMAIMGGIVTIGCVVVVVGGLLVIGTKGSILKSPIASIVKHAGRSLIDK